MLLTLPLLSACAARVSDLHCAAARAPQPAEILVDVARSPALSAASAVAADETVVELRRAIVDDLVRAHVPATMLGTDRTPAGATVLRVEVADASAGNAFTRFIIGFGAGKATLQVRAELDRETGRGHSKQLASFNTASDTGHRPGLILPGGITAATGSLTNLAVGGGLGLVSATRNGLQKPIRKTATAIVSQVRAYGTAAGWTWVRGAGG